MRSRGRKQRVEETLIYSMGIPTAELGAQVAQLLKDYPEVYDIRVMEAGAPRVGMGLWSLWAYCPRISVPLEEPRE